MGSFNRCQIFDPLDLEIIDRVYETAWAHIETRDLYRDTEKNGEREDALRKTVLPLQGLARSISTLSATKCCRVSPTPEVKAARLERNLANARP